MTEDKLARLEEIERYIFKHDINYVRKLGNFTDYSVDRATIQWLLTELREAWAENKRLNKYLRQDEIESRQELAEKTEALNKVCACEVQIDDSLKVCAACEVLAKWDRSKEER